jgi:hypothetical protein
MPARGVRSSWLTSALLGLGAGCVARLDPVEHAVERGGQPAEFGARGRELRDTAGEVSGGDGHGGGLDAAQRPQSAAHREPSGKCQESQDRGVDQQDLLGELAHGVIDVAA